jgi:DNA-binding MarR family transcriptional regulator
MIQADVLDRFSSDLKKERPDLDPRPLQIVGRLSHLANRARAGAARVLKPYGLTPQGFDTLASLRAAGAPYELTPSQLCYETQLSSGAMTSRLDKLEREGHVRRVRSKSDRRSVHVRLTARGKRVVDRALPVRLREAEQAVEMLTARERSGLERLLRKVSLSYDV